ncbi:EF-hand domain-containing protein [Abortiporus biennis]
MDNSVPPSPVKFSKAIEELRVSSPRPETPEPDSRQGRRNPRAAGVQLLDDEGAISEQLEECLKHIFAKYCSPPPLPGPSSKKSGLLVPPEGACLTSEGLDAWATDTNGKPFDEETKEELADYMDTTDEGFLTFRGFMQVYQLQTENDEEETWKDLSSHGFDRTLRLVATRREDAESDYKGSTPNLPDQLETSS